MHSQKTVRSQCGEVVVGNENVMREILSLRCDFGGEYCRCGNYIMLSSMLFRRHRMKCSQCGEVVVGNENVMREILLRRCGFGGEYRRCGNYII